MILIKLKWLNFVFKNLVARVSNLLNWFSCQTKAKKNSQPPQKVNRVHHCPTTPTFEITAQNFSQIMKTLFSHNLMIAQSFEQVHSKKAFMYDFDLNTNPDLRINLPQTPLPDSPFFRLLAILLTIYGRDIKFNVFIIHQTNMSVAEMWNRCEDESEEKNSSRWWFPVVKTIERYKRKHNLRFTWYR